MKKKIIHLLVITTALCNTLHAQPVIQNQKDIGGTDYDEMRTAYFTKDGGYILGGISYSNKSYQKSQNIRGGQDYWVVKVDSSGKIQWDKTIGGNSDDNLKAVIQTLDGGYALVGESLSNISVEKSENSWGASDWWLVKLDSAGNIEWDKTIGGNGDDFIDHIVQTSDSGYVLAGSSASSISGYKSEDTRGLFDYWVVKVNKRGKKEWDKTIGGNDYEFCSPFIVTSDGGILLGGFSQSNISGEKTQDSRGGYDIWLVKLTGKGKIQWDKTIGGNDFDGAFSIIQMNDGGYMLGASSASNMSGEKSDNSYGLTDYWLVKIDAKGNKLWDKTIGGSGDDGLSLGDPLAVTSDGGFILGGTSNSYISGNKTEDNRGNNDYWIVKLDSNANIQWDKTIGGSDNDVLRFVKEIKPNLYFTAGSSSSAISGDKTAFSRGSSDYWVVKVKFKKPSAELAAFADNDLLSFQKNPINQVLAVSPNPSGNIFNVRTNGTASIALLNQSGKVLLTKTINGNGVINVANLPVGLYYIKNNSTGESQKVIVSR